MSEKVELLIEDCTCLTDTDNTHENGLTRSSVAIADGKIIAVGDPADLAARYTPIQRIAGNQRLLTPGFVDSHTHLVFAGDRSQEFIRRCQGAGYEEIAAEGGGIRASVRATRKATEEELYQLALPRLQRMLAGGTTTVEIKSGYGLDTETELRMLRVAKRLADATPARVVTTFLGAHEVPDELRSDRNAYIDEVCETMIPQVAEQQLAEYCDVFCERGVFTPEETTRILRCGQKHGLAAKIHADELASSGGSEVAAEVGAISADHLMKITETGIAGLKAKGVVPTLLPGTTFYLGKNDYAPARALLRAGLPVALATDRNPGSCTIENMQFILGLGALRMGMTPLECFRAATTHGARALRRHEQLGRIAEGYVADLILWEAHNLAQVVYEMDNQIPRQIYCGGKLLA